MKAILLTVIFFGFILGLALLAVVTPLLAKGEVAGDVDEN